MLRRRRGRFLLSSASALHKILFLIGTLLTADMSAFSSPAEYTGGAKAAGGSLPPPRRPLPEKLLIGYATNCNNDGVIAAVRQGVNVIIWSFMEIHSEDSGGGGGPPRNDATSISGHATTIRWNSLDLDCIRSTIEKLDQEGFDDTVHLVSFGGWNGPHLDAKLSATEWFQTWKASAGEVFHGIDWDLEGHDDLQSPTNLFTMDCLEKMGCISRLAKEEGYIIGIAPPQSYLDTASSKFSRSVIMEEPDRGWHPEFHYFGANVYAYLLAKYDEYIDFCSIQFYESYSRAAMAIDGPEKMAPEEYLVKYVKDLVEQSETLLVDFEDDPDTLLSNMRVPLPLSKLVLGFANGWAIDTGDKALYIKPEAIQKAYDRLEKDGQNPRGFMFWVIGEEGKNGVSYAPALNQFLQTRAAKTSTDVGEL